MVFLGCLSFNSFKFSAIPFIQIIEGMGGLQFPTVRNSSWNSFLNSKLDLVDFEVVAILSDIEGEKQVLNMRCEKLMDLFINDPLSTSKRDKQLLKIQLLEVINSEEGLIEKYKAYSNWYKDANR